MALSMLFMDRNFYSNFSSKDHSNYNDSLRIAGICLFGTEQAGCFMLNYTAVILALLMIDDNFRRKMLFWRLWLSTIFVWCFSFPEADIWHLLSVGCSWITSKIGVLFWCCFVCAQLAAGGAGICSATHRYDRRQGGRNRPVDWTAIHHVRISQSAKSKRISHFGTRFAHRLRIWIYVDHARKSLHNGHIEDNGTGFVGIIIFLVSGGAGITMLRLYTMTDDKFLKGLGLGIRGLCAGGISRQHCRQLLVLHQRIGFYLGKFGVGYAAIDIVGKKKRRWQIEQNLFLQQSTIKNLFTDPGEVTHFCYKLAEFYRKR